MVRRRSTKHQHHDDDDDDDDDDDTVVGVVCFTPKRRTTTTLHLLLFVMLLMILSVVKVATGFRCSTIPAGGQRTSSFIAPMVVLQKTAAAARSSCTAPVSSQYSYSSSSTSSSSSLSMFMGSDGGLLGIGTPEVVTILLVGYFILGPSDLYKLVKEIGKFIQNIRTMGTDLTTSFENNMESQLQLEELRKAQRELNDAFSFRRSINTNPNEQEAFTTTVETPREPSVVDYASTMAGAATATATTTGGARKNMRRKRVVIKKKQPPLTTNPDSLEMPAAAAATTMKNDNNRPRDPFIQDSDEYLTKEEEDAINADFDKYTLGTGPNNNDNDDEDRDTTFNKYNNYGLPPPVQQKQEQSRFQQQLSSGTWNEQVLRDQQDQGQGAAPPAVGQIMQLLAVLEEEKIAATKRLEEEFRKRAEMDEAFYQKQRQLLKDASIQIQQEQQAQEAQKTE